LSTMPGSFKATIRNSDLDTSLYWQDDLKSQFVLTDSLLTDTVWIHYRVLPVALSAVFYNKDQNLMLSESPKPYTVPVAPQDPFSQSDSGIEESGSISRGISFGNAQNLSVNSSLNLQLTGRLTDRFKLLASVTDDNIPIQPDGSTQQLQDFDQVFIQVYDDRSKLIAGDFILRRPESYFLNYFKRAQGGYVQTFMPTGGLGFNQKPNGLNVEASGAVSKGRFARNTFQGVEGNQGPYRLTGADGEKFVIILAGTEAVYIDGRKLERGQDRDYVIDYNAAEIVFTPRQFITKDIRITVEFQYSEKRYARPLLQTSITYQRPGARWFLNMYSESDARNQPLQQDLTQAQKFILSEAGDDLLAAFTTGADSVAYDDNLVLYALRDSLGFDSVYVYSTHPDSAHYRVSFTEVGAGQGDYVEEGFTANGRKFRWIVPVISGNDTLHQGTHSPILLLAPPRKKQMFTLGGTFVAGRHMTIDMEGAVSVNDLNTFSSQDSNDDLGHAWKLVHRWDSRKSVPTDSLAPKRGWLQQTQYEFTAATFSPVERFREVEFTRNWNLGTTVPPGHQHIAGTSGTLMTENHGRLTVGAEMLLAGQDYTGFKSKLSPALFNKKSNLTADASYLRTSGDIRSAFLRHKSRASHTVGSIRLGFRDEHENNVYYVGTGDTLSTLSYRFYDWEVSAGTADTLKKSLTVFYRERTDGKSDTTLLRNAAHARQYGATLMLKDATDNVLRIQVSNRSLRVINSELFTGSPENTLLLRTEYNARWMKGGIALSTFYEAGSGLEQQREFIYLEVQPGQGNYIWNDYNGDGVKDLNEFEPAQFAYEANYIRTFVQSNTYIKTYSNQFSQTLNLQPARILAKDKKWKTFVARFSNLSSYKTDRKTTRADDALRYNPFLTDVNDTSLMALSRTARSAFFFNKSHPVFGMDYTWQDNRVKNLLSNGFESRTDQYHQGALRWTFVRDFVFNSQIKSGIRSAASDFLTGRNYRIEYLSLQPGITWQPVGSATGINGRFSLLGEWTDKSNTSGSEKATIARLGAEAILSGADKGNLQLGLNYYVITFNSDTNNSLSFDMLEGLSAGNNITANATWQQSLANNLQLTLLYNGRKTGDNKVIHSGGVQVRAIF
ncbi:MAG: hypothetical protein JNM00_14555, partial [Flavobacteriales bacterium]|nr:hypothetical protein [Flavobacteriales bacterium]